VGAGGRRAMNNLDDKGLSIGYFSPMRYYRFCHADGHGIVIMQNHDESAVILSVLYNAFCDDVVCVLFKKKYVWYYDTGSYKIDMVTKNRHYSRFGKAVITWNP